MTVMYGWLQRLIYKSHDRPDSTTELINEAERTRRELLRITERLAGHVAQLKAFTRAYTARDSEGIDHG
jgi:N6-adenosine-specific RNA methylase IME4